MKKFISFDLRRVFFASFDLIAVCILSMLVSIIVFEFDIFHALGCQFAEEIYKTIVTAIIVPEISRDVYLQLSSCRAMSFRVAHTTIIAASTLSLICAALSSIIVIDKYKERMSRVELSWPGNWPFILFIFIIVSGIYTSFFSDFIDVPNDLALNIRDASHFLFWVQFWVGMAVAHFWPIMSLLLLIAVFSKRKSSTDES